MLSEEQAQGFFNFPDRAQFYLEFLGVKTLHIVAWNDDMAETEFFGLGNALLYAEAEQVKKNLARIKSAIKREQKTCLHGRCRV